MCAIREYYKKHGVWPPLTGGSKKVQAHQRENSWPGGQDKFRQKDFNSVVMGKMSEFDFKVDTSELLKDKSCCPEMSKWTTEYDTRYYKEKYGVNPPKVKGSQNRVILEYLDREEVNCEELIMDFVNNLPLEMLFAVRAWKEEEMNGKKGRGFTKLVFEPRIYQTSCEGNMKRVMEYFPFQTITKGGMP